MTACISEEKEEEGDDGLDTTAQRREEVIVVETAKGQMSARLSREGETVAQRQQLLEERSLPSLCGSANRARWLQSSG
uniref:Uncharacterized protein n=1 Tax=Peronospora matthiolae TaxID=2874970 RepID=A0AAV1V0Z6_9STRA